MNFVRLEILLRSGVREAGASQHEGPNSGPPRTSRQYGTEGFKVHIYYLFIFAYLSEKYIFSLYSTLYINLTDICTFFQSLTTVVSSIVKQTFPFPIFSQLNLLTDHKKKPETNFELNFEVCFQGHKKKLPKIFNDGKLIPKSLKK